MDRVEVVGDGLLLLVLLVLLGLLLHRRLTTRDAFG